MASRIIGRKECPECGFEAAHIKESDKCLYRYCPACGINGPHARTEAQRENMRRGMRPVDAAPAPSPTPSPAPGPTQPTATPSASPTPTEPSPTPSQAPATPAAPKRRGLFG